MLNPVAFVVKDKDLVDEPGGEAVGDAYIVGNPAVGAWVGYDYWLALCVSTGPTVWSFMNPGNGYRAWVLDEEKYYVQPSITGTPAAWVVDSVFRSSPLKQMQLVFNDGPGGVTAGVKCWVPIPSPCTITGWRMVADVSGDIVVDLWADDFTSFPPAGGDSITAGAYPSLVAAQTAEDTVLAGWTKSLSAGDWMAANVISASTVTYVILVLSVV